MTSRTVWNGFRVCAIVTLGTALVVLNIVLAVPQHTCQRTSY